MNKLKITGATYRHRVLRSEFEKPGRTIGWLADILFCCRHTARSRLSTPEGMAVGELKILAGRWNWTDEQIARFVRNE